MLRPRCRQELSAFQTKIVVTRGFSKATATKPRFHSYCQQVTNVASAPGDKATALGFLKAIGLLGLVEG